MSPVHSFPAPGYRIRRRPVPQSAAQLFPDCPEAVGPNALTRELAPLASPSSSSHGSLAGCPPLVASEAGLAAAPVSTGALRSPAATAAAPLVGIARLASISPPAESKRRSEERPEYFLLPVRSILNRCNSSRVPFEWTINPYRGCEFGCKYCYARYTHEFMELRDPRQFEEKIYAKEFQAAAFQSELDRIPVGETIAIGTATDPYQPAERRFRVTRRILET